MFAENLDLVVLVVPANILAVISYFLVVLGRSVSGYEQDGRWLLKTLI